MYRGGRPNAVAKALNRLSSRMAASGRAPRQLYSLEVRGRRSGRTISFPVVVADHEGERYLVAMLGEGVNWVANVRAAGGQAVLRHGDREEVVLEEVDPRDRAPILKRYLELAPGARAHIAVDPSAPVEEFEPIAADHPVFRIQARLTQARARRPRSIIPTAAASAPATSASRRPRCRPPGSRSGSRGPPATGNSPAR